VKLWNNSVHIRIASALVLVLITTFLLREIRMPVSAAADYECGKPAPGEVEIAIARGATGSAIARTLFDAGVTKSSQTFFRLAVADPRSAKVAPGTHTLELQLCAQDALTQLLDSKRIKGLINITEGMWISEVLPQMYAAGILKSEVLLALKELELPKGFSTTEGLLFPAQYSFASGTSATEAFSAMLRRSEEEMRRAGFFNSSDPFTPQQFLAIASLIQAEGNTQDFTKIAQVIRNRLRIGMPLQFDSTVHYIKKSRGSVFLSTQSTLINSPYNTYKRYGLPPGPINNPGQDAMQAAMNPDAGDWLYFITVAPFDTRFTSSIQEFNNWKLEYKENLKAGKFRSSP
jgi:UPF0755 protein